jgi:hypothetical protein
MKYIGNPMLRAMSGIVPGYAVIEVVGRKTGQRHRVNVGGRRIGDTFWFLARADAQYIRNLEVLPEIRIRLRGRWQRGIAKIRPEMDSRTQLLRLNPINGFFLWLVGVDLLIVQVPIGSAT